MLEILCSKEAYNRRERVTVSILEMHINYETVGKASNNSTYTIEADALESFNADDTFNLIALLNFICAMPDVERLTIQYKYLSNNQMKLGAHYFTTKDIHGFNRYEIDIVDGSLNKPITETASSFRDAKKAMKKALMTDLDLICILDSLKQK